ncbi:MAG: hypothetical protein ACKPGT_03630, partial [Microcystis sp.]
ASRITFSSNYCMIFSIKSTGIFQKNFLQLMELTKDELPYTPHSKLSTAKDQDFTSKYPLDRD